MLNPGKRKFWLVTIVYVWPLGCFLFRCIAIGFEIEAITASCPVITTRYCEIDVIENGTNGILFSQRNPSAISNIIE